MTRNTERISRIEVPIRDQSMLHLPHLDAPIVITIIIIIGTIIETGAETEITMSRMQMEMIIRILKKRITIGEVQVMGIIMIIDIVIPILRGDSQIRILTIGVQPIVPLMTMIPIQMNILMIS